MPRRYLSVNLSENQQQFLKLLDEYEVDIFSLDDVEEQIWHYFKNINEILENLVDKEFISRIEKGKYCKANFRDELVIGTYVSKDSAVAYWTALNRHGLTEQFSNTVFIQTTHLKNDKSIFGVPYKFIKVAPRKRVGLIKEGYGNRSYMMTNIEKTIVDCFDLPQYSGGYAELIRAVAMAELRPDQLIESCKAVRNIAVTKRIGFLIELFEKSNLDTFLDYAKTQVNPKYNLFDPQGSEKGEFVADWKLRLNIDKEDILALSDSMH